MKRYKINKVGPASFGITIPPFILYKLNLKYGDEVDIDIDTQKEIIYIKKRR